MALYKQLSVLMHQTDTCESALSEKWPLQHLKLPKASVNFQKRIRFVHDAQVEMAFINEIIPIFQPEQLYSSSLTCFK